MKQLFLSIIILNLFINVMGQEKSTIISLEADAIGTTNGKVPFWLRSNQFGSIPLSGTSLSIIPSINKSYDKTRKRLLDWGFGLESRLNLGSTFHPSLIEGYAKVKFGYFQLKAGRSKDIMGFVGDSLLTSGSFAMSGNSLGIPKVEISVPEYSYLLGGKLFAFKGSFSHGWIGSIPAMHPNENDSIYNTQTYFHQSSLYIRFGKPTWKLNLIGGINHEVFWGNDRSIFGPSEINLSNSQEYIYVITGKKFFNNNTATRDISKVGNHLGSIDLGFQYDFKNFNLIVYRQSFYDKGALYYLANLLDGLNGITFVNKKISRSKLNWNKILFEVLYSKNQAGESWSKPTPSGPEDYYNHAIYIDGYSYYNLGIGTPFITTHLDAVKGLPWVPNEFFINNRILLFHMGVNLSIKNIQLVGIFSYSKNYGTYHTSNETFFYFNKHKIPYHPTNGIFGEYDQKSIIINLQSKIIKNYYLHFSSAADIGELLYNSLGIQIGIKKYFL